MQTEAKLRTNIVESVVWDGKASLRVRDATHAFLVSVSSVVMSPA